MLIALSVPLIRSILFYYIYVCENVSVSDLPTTTNQHGSKQIPAQRDSQEPTDMEQNTIQPLVSTLLI